MSENSPALKKSFFKEYFFYKLRTLRGFMILFAATNLISTALLSAGLLIYANTTLLTYYREAAQNQYISSWFSVFAGAISAVIFAELLMLAIVPAVNYKFFNKRAYMDTIGALPLTEKQRFFGDMLSGMSSFMISFVPCGVIAVILGAVTEFGPLREVHRLSNEKYGETYYMIAEMKDNIIGLVLICLATLLICCAAAYVISCFVTSCCGKVGTSVLFSVILIGEFFVIVYTFVNFIAESAVGVDGSIAAEQILSAVPPIGTLLAAIYNIRDMDSVFIVTTPLILIVLLIVAAFGAGAYLAAKCRKAERVGREIVFDVGYYVISVTIILMAGGMCRFMVNGWAPYSVPLLLISLATSLVMAFLQSRSLKNIRKGFVVFAVTSAACFGFGILVRSTGGLGISKTIPLRQSIESVELSGPAISKLFGWNEDFYDSVTVKSDEGISLILSEHKKIVDNLEDYSTDLNREGGDVLSIQYNLKGGLISYRSYRYYGDSETDPLEELTQSVSELPEMRFNTIFGVLEDPSKPCINITYGGRRPDDLMNEEHIMLIVKPSEQKRFVECFKKDLMNTPALPDEDDRSFGFIKYNYLDSSGELKSIGHMLWYSYKETIAFLQDPDNFEEEAEIAVDETKLYSVFFSISDNNRISYTITHPELASEFMSYLEPAYSTNTDEYSEYFTIQNNDGYNFRIKKENEQAALSAFMRAIRAHRALGGDYHDQN